MFNDYTIKAPEFSIFCNFFELSNILLPIFSCSIGSSERLDTLNSRNSYGSQKLGNIGKVLDLKNLKLYG